MSITVHRAPSLNLGDVSSIVFGDGKRAEVDTDGRLFVYGDEDKLLAAFTGWEYFTVGPALRFDQDTAVEDEPEGEKTTDSLDEGPAEGDAAPDGQPFALPLSYCPCNSRGRSLWEGRFIFP